MRGHEMVAKHSLGSNTKEWRKEKPNGLILPGYDALLFEIQKRLTDFDTTSLDAPPSRRKETQEKIPTINPTGHSIEAPQRKEHKAPENEARHENPFPVKKSNEENLLAEIQKRLSDFDTTSLDALPSRRKETQEKIPTINPTGHSIEAPQRKEHKAPENEARHENPFPIKKSNEENLLAEIQKRLSDFDTTSLDAPPSSKKETLKKTHRDNLLNQGNTPPPLKRISSHKNNRDREHSSSFGEGVEKNWLLQNISTALKHTSENMLMAATDAIPDRREDKKNTFPVTQNVQEPSSSLLSGTNKSAELSFDPQTNRNIGSLPESDPDHSRDKFFSDFNRPWKNDDDKLADILQKRLSSDKDTEKNKKENSLISSKNETLCTDMKQDAMSSSCPIPKKTNKPYPDVTLDKTLHKEGLTENTTRAPLLPCKQDYNLKNLEKFVQALADKIEKLARQKDDHINPEPAIGKIANIAKSFEDNNEKLAKILSLKLPMEHMAQQINTIRDNLSHTSKETLQAIKDFSQKVESINTHIDTVHRNDSQKTKEDLTEAVEKIMKTIRDESFIKQDAKTETQAQAQAQAPHDNMLMQRLQKDLNNIQFTVSTQNEQQKTVDVTQKEEKLENDNQPFLNKHQTTSALLASARMAAKNAQSLNKKQNGNLRNRTMAFRHNSKKETQDPDDMQNVSRLSGAQKGVKSPHYFIKTRDLQTLQNKVFSFKIMEKMRSGIEARLFEKLPGQPPPRIRNSVWVATLTTSAILLLVAGSLSIYDRISQITPQKSFASAKQSGKKSSDILLNKVATIKNGEQSPSSLQEEKTIPEQVVQNIIPQTQTTKNNQKENARFSEFTSTPYIRPLPSIRKR
ncbi:MAG: hypothetical protein PSN37_02430 [Alphaproteobacteria bacterium]|nr:hypothetical protein [Alphaproteobacteria bacterium]